MHFYIIHKNFSVKWRLKLSPSIISGNERENIVLREVIYGCNTLRDEGERQNGDRQELSLHHAENMMLYT